MLKKFGIFILTAVLSVVASAGFRGGELQQFAPAGTEVIVFLNGSKISGTRVFKAWQQTPSYRELATEAGKKANLDINAIMQGSICFFIKTNDPEKVCGVYSDSNGMAARIAESLKQEEGGKAVILGDGTLAFAVDGATIPGSKRPTQLTGAIDNGALASVAYKFELTEAIGAAMNDEAAQPFKPMINGLKIVTLNVYDAGETLELQLVADYDTPEAAQSALESLIALRTLIMAGFSGQPETEEYANIIKAIKLGADGQKVTARLSYSQDELVKLIENLDRGGTSDK